MLDFSELRVPFFRCGNPAVMGMLIQALQKKMGKIAEDFLAGNCNQELSCIT